jgi:colanic acid/amylovoran biosynthesis protein
VVGHLPPTVARSVDVDGSWHDPPALRRRLGTFDLVVATRLHAGILALTAGVPVFPIAYEFKTDELYERLGLGRWVQQLATLEASSAASALDAFLESLPASRADLFARVASEGAETHRVARATLAKIDVPSR